MGKNKYLNIGIIVVGVIVNFLFGLYNLKVTKRVKKLNKIQSFFILLLSSVNTLHGVIHLIINIAIGAYKRR